MLWNINMVRFPGHFFLFPSPLTLRQRSQLIGEEETIASLFLLPPLSLLLSSSWTPGLPPPTLAFVCQIRGVLCLELPAVPTLPLGPHCFLLSPCLAARGLQ